MDKNKEILYNLISLFFEKLDYTKNFENKEESKIAQKLNKLFEKRLSELTNFNKFNELMCDFNDFINANDIRTSLDRF